MNAYVNHDFFQRYNMTSVLIWFIVTTFFMYSYLTYYTVNIASSTQVNLVHNVNVYLDTLSTPDIRLDTPSTPKVLPHQAQYDIVKVNKVDHPASSDNLCVTKQADNSLKCRLSTCNNENKKKRTQSRLLYGYGGKMFQRDDSIIKGAQKTPNGKRRGQASGCIMSHKYKFIYIHVLKSGGSTIKHFLKRGLCQVSELHEPCKNDESYFFVNQSCNDMVKEHPDYFVWAMVRNPFSRMYSAYSMLAHNPRDENSKNISFSDFVMGNGKFRKRLSRKSVDHYDPQQSFLFDENECPNFDYVGKLENMDEDMAFILKQINSPELNSIFESSNNTMWKENSYGEDDRKKQLGDNLRMAFEDERVVQKIAREFDADFRLFGYDRLEVPLK